MAGRIRSGTGFSVSPPDNMSFLVATLMVPGCDRELLTKLTTGSADSYFIDLEDTVPEADKDFARAACVDALSTRRADAPVFVRINALDRGCLDADLNVALLPGGQGINLPKTESADDVVTLDRELCRREAIIGRPVGSTEIILTVETAKGVSALPQIALASSRTRYLCVGIGDLTRDLGLGPQGVELSPALVAAQIAAVYVSRIAGLQPPHDSTHAIAGDFAGLIHRAAATAKLGFVGKHALHAAHLDLIRTAYRSA
jgi:citrate lyase subunit beta / citryl-CoA lyase